MSKSFLEYKACCNFQVSQNGLDVCGLLIERLGVSFRHYVNTVLPPTVDRLGDSKESVRERASSVLNRYVAWVLKVANNFLPLLPSPFLYRVQ